jgi:hypothetical protein
MLFINDFLPRCHSLRFASVKAARHAAEATKLGVGDNLRILYNAEPLLSATINLIARKVL